MTDQREKAWRTEHQTPFDLEQYGDLLVAILDKVRTMPDWSQAKLGRILRQHPLPDGKTLSKSQLLKGYAQLCTLEEQEPDPMLYGMSSEQTRFLPQVPQLRGRPSHLLGMPRRARRVVRDG